MEESIATSRKPEKLYRYFPLDPCKEEFLDRILDIIGEHRLYAPAPRELNDPFDCIVKLGNSDQSREEGIQRRVNGQAGVLSFSEKRDHILMWAHYANKHSGVCLEFNFNGWKRMPVHLDRVEYRMERPLISPTDLSNATSDRSLPGTSFGTKPTIIREPDLLKKMAFTKHEDWKYEKEWRIICAFKNPSERYLKFPREENVLNGIIFGLRTSDNDRQRIREAVESSGANISFYKAIEKNNRFEVEIIPSD